MYCTQCGKKIDDAARFCSHCGAKVQQTDAEPVSEPAPKVTPAPVKTPKAPKAPQKGKLALKIVTAVVLVAVVTAGVLLWLWNRNVADVPDPEAFFAELAEVKTGITYTKMKEYCIGSDSNELYEATLAYCKMLMADGEFVLTEEEWHEDGGFYMSYHYNGEKLLLNRQKQ